MADIAVLAPHAYIDGVARSEDAYFAHRSGIYARKRALVETVAGAIVEAHLDGTPVHEIELLLKIVIMPFRLIPRRSHEHVDAKGSDVEGFANFAKAIASTDRVDVADGIAVADGELKLAGILHS